MHSAHVSIVLSHPLDNYGDHFRVISTEMKIRSKEE
ncbi:unnamed protein product, partial [Heterotrigona itama]